MVAHQALASFADHRLSPSLRFVVLMILLGANVRMPEGPSLAKQDGIRLTRNSNHRRQEGSEIIRRFVFELRQSPSRLKWRQPMGQEVSGYNLEGS